MSGKKQVDENTGEITAPFSIPNTGTGHVVGDMVAGFKVKKVLTLQRFLLKDEIPMILKPLSPFYEGSTASKEGEKGAVRNEQGKWQKPIPLMKCALYTSANNPPINVELICPTILQNELDKLYPKSGFLEKLFHVTVHAKQAGKQYKNVDIAEMEA